MENKKLQLNINGIFDADTCRTGAAYTAVGMIFFTVFSLVFLRLSLASTIGFILFQILAVALPGIAVTKVLNLSLSPLEALVTSYGFGMCSTLIVYFPLAYTGNPGLIPYGEAVLVVISVIANICLRKKPLSRRADNGEMRIALAVCFIVSAITLITFSATYLNPSISGARSYYHDTMNAVTVLASAKISYPFEFLQMAGTIYWYHPFMYSYGAVLSLCTNTCAFDVVTKLLTVTISPFGAAAFIAAAKRIGLSKRSIWVLSVPAFIFPAGTTIWYYLYEDVLGFPLGIAFGAIALNFFLKGQSINSKMNRYHAVSAFFIAMCTGAKGPVAVTFVFAICFVLLIELIRDRNLWIFPKGLSFAVPFIAFYFLLYGTATDESMSFSVGYSAVRSVFGHFMSDTFGENAFSTLISCIGYSIVFQPVVTIAFVFALVKLFKTKAKDDFYIFAASGTLFGLVMIELFKQMGSSEWYFNMCMYQVAVIAIVRALSEIRLTRKKLFKGLSVALAAGWLVLGIYKNAEFITRSVKNIIKYSPYSTSRAFEPEEVAFIENRGNSISPKEYDGYIFIKENVDKYAIIADYRYSLNNKFFMGSAFSEHMFFLDGWGYVTMEDGNDNTDQKVARDLVMRSFYDFEDEDFIPLLKTYGITHLVLTDYINPGWRLEGRYTTTLFENSDIAIYEIN